MSETFDLSERSVLITGGSRGLGRSLVTRFSEAGARVVFTYRREAGKARDLVRRLRRAGASVEAISADLTVRTEVEDLFADLTNRTGPLHVLINNAGVYPQAPLVSVSDEVWRQTLEVNLTATHVCTQCFARSTHRAKESSVINVASIEAHDVAPDHAHYGASKAAVLMYTRAAARELGPLGIRVNSVSPGLLWRPGLRKAWPEGVDSYEKAAPLARIGHPHEVADICLFLASRAARWVTGANLVVDGGVLVSGTY